MARNNSSVEFAKAFKLRKQLVNAALKWERHLGVAPSITTAVSELDAARLVGMKEDNYCRDGRLRTAVSRDVDFVCNRTRYQVTANRPSGKPWSKVTLVSRKTEEKRPFGWDKLIWLLYDRRYVLQEAWVFTAKKYRKLFSHLTRLSPDHMRKGRCLFENSN